MKQPTYDQLLFKRIDLEKEVMSLTKLTGELMLELASTYTVIKMKDIELNRNRLH